MWRHGHGALGMHGGGALAPLHVESGSWQLGTLDESNAFSYVRTPRWMWKWFAAPPLLAGEIWPVLPRHLQRALSPRDTVYPIYTRLPMGSSHAVYILMSINLQAVGRALIASRRLLPYISSRAPAGGIGE